MSEIWTEAGNAERFKIRLGVKLTERGFVIIPKMPEFAELTERGYVILLRTKVKSAVSMRIRE
ncbi:hypothetical protein PRECH8_09880 [Insulibacter thermoxylanivorax]|uniref:Uncharacterized protein n=1 Tax=Insulibacter thermoxylanivorax TaxID=2749268 RepID=A0A916QFX6_9BACL|nr:hypothetical protein PRECH8_09880 [Insulibacter thermoxylanivorax]